MDTSAQNSTQKSIIWRIFHKIFRPPAVRAYDDLLERDRIRLEEKLEARAAEGEI